ncbi:hypothetical protein DFJ74DRAFT_682354 [Hyaloraphidium curvatum]|nr:hypothetical protein DFJ74DRAFT_682354 [Hyaloraphidium curvatum]
MESVEGTAVAEGAPAARAPTRLAEIDELVAHILGYLVGDKPRHILTAMLACRAFFRLGAPFLYRDVRLFGRAGAKGRALLETPPPLSTHLAGKPPSQFVRSLLVAPGMPPPLDVLTEVAPRLSRLELMLPSRQYEEAAWPIIRGANTLRKLSLEWREPPASMPDGDRALPENLREIDLFIRHMCRLEPFLAAMAALPELRKWTLISPPWTSAKPLYLENPALLAKCADLTLTHFALYSMLSELGPSHPFRPVKLTIYCPPSHPAWPASSSPGPDLPHSLETIRVDMISRASPPWPLYERIAALPNVRELIFVPPAECPYSDVLARLPALAPAVKVVRAEADDLHRLAAVPGLRPRTLIVAPPAAAVDEGLLSRAWGAISAWPVDHAAFRHGFPTSLLASAALPRSVRHIAIEAPRFDAGSSAFPRIRAALSGVRAIDVVVEKPTDGSTLNETEKEERALWKTMLNVRWREVPTECAQGHHHHHGHHHHGHHHHQQPQQGGQQQQQAGPGADG